MPGNLVNLTPEAIAQWPEPNYVDPYRRTWVNPVLVLLQSLATLAIALRLWVRYRKHGGGLGIDDALISAAWFLSCGFTVCGILGVELTASNRHMWDIPVPLWERLALLTGIAEIVYLLAGGCIRVSVLLFYRRLVDDTCSRRWRFAIIGAIVFTAGWVSACTCAITFSCTPIDAYWRSFDPGYKEKYHCVDIAVVNYLVGTLTIVGDIYAVALPCIITWDFTMPRSQKIGLNLVFGTSLIVVAVCCVRNYFLFRLSKESDFSWVLTEINICSQLEIQIATLCACAPALRVLFRQYLRAPMRRVFGLQVSEKGQDSTASGANMIQEDPMSDKQCQVDFASALAGKWSVGGSDTDRTSGQARLDVCEQQVVGFV